MFGGLFATVFGKVAAVVVTVGGVAGGLAVTDALPMLSQMNVNTPVVVPVAGPAGIAVPMQGGPALSFPDLPKLHQAVIDQGAQRLASTASTQALRSASQAEGKARQAAAAAQKCLDSLTAEVNALVAGVPGITSADQAAAMVAKARTIGDNATACAKQATALGQSGIDQISKAAAQLNSAVAQIGSLNLQNGANQVVQGAQDTLGTVTKNIDKSSGSALGMFGQISDMAAALMATAMEYQNKFNQPSVGGPVVNNPTPTVPTVPTATNPWGAFGDVSSWMALANQMQQAGGTAGSTRGTTDTSTSTGSNTGRDGDWRTWFSGR